MAVDDKKISDKILDAMWNLNKFGEKIGVNFTQIAMIGVGLGYKLEELIENDVQLIKTIIDMKDEIVKTFNSIWKDFNRTLTQWGNVITRPISSIITPILLISGGIWKILKTLRQWRKDGRGQLKFWEHIKHDLLDFIKFLGVGVGLAVGFIIRRFELIGKLFEPVITFLKPLFSSSGPISGMISGFIKIMSTIFKPFTDLESFNSGFIGKGISNFLSFFEKIKILFTENSMIISGTEMIEGLFSTINKVGSFLRGFLKIDSVINGVMSVSRIIFGSFESLLTIIKPFISGITKGMELMRGPMGKFIFWPIQVILSVIDFVKGFMSTEGNIGDKILGGIKSVFKGILEPFTKLVEIVGGWLGFNTTGLSDNIINVLYNIFQLIFRPFYMIYDIIRGWIETGNVIGGFVKLFEGITKYFLSFFDNVGKLFGVNGLLDMLLAGISSIPMVPSYVKDWFIKQITSLKSSGTTTTQTDATIQPSTSTVNNYNSSITKTVPQTSFTPTLNNKMVPEVQQMVYNKPSNSQNQNSNVIVAPVQPVHQAPMANVPRISSDHIPVDIENLGILLLTKSWGLS